MAVDRAAIFSPVLARQDVRRASGLPLLYVRGFRNNVSTVAAQITVAVAIQETSRRKVMLQRSARQTPISVPRWRIDRSALLSVR